MTGILSNSLTLDQFCLSVPSGVLIVIVACTALSVHSITPSSPRAFLKLRDYLEGKVRILVFSRTSGILLTFLI